MEQWSASISRLARFHYTNRVKLYHGPCARALASS